MQQHHRSKRKNGPVINTTASTSAAFPHHHEAPLASSPRLGGINMPREEDMPRFDTEKIDIKIFGFVVVRRFTYSKGFFRIE